MPLETKWQLCYIIIEYLFNEILFNKKVLESGMYIKGDRFMTREEQKEQRKTQIVSAGLRIFVKKGYAATKITDIAKEAGMSTGLLFHYFESKEQLFVELVQTGLQGTKVPFQMDFKSPLDFFEGFAQVLLTYIKEQPETALYFVLMGQVSQSEGIPRQAEELAAKVNTTEQSVAIIKMGQQAGIIKKGDPLALASAFWCCIQGIAEQYVIHPEIPLPEASWIVDIIKKQ